MRKGGESILKPISVSRQFAPLRVCADICFYLYAVSLFSFNVIYSYSDGEEYHGVVSNLIAPWSLQLAIFVAACLAAGIVAVRADSLPLRFILSLLPGLSFLMSPFQPVLLIHAAAWVYFVIVITVGSFEVHLDVYRRRAGVMLFITLMLTLCLIVFHFGTDEWYSARFFGGEGYGLLFFVLCVFSLRGMRTELGAPKKMRLLDAAFVIALPLLLLFSVFLMRFGVPVISALITLLSRFLIWLRHLIFPESPPVNPLFSPEGDDPIAEKEALPVPADEFHAPEGDPVGSEIIRHLFSPDVLFWIMIALLAAALILIAVRLIRRRPKGHDKPRLASETIERTPFEGRRRRRPGEAALPANVRQIRKIYRSYLSHIRSLRLKVSPSDTSEDVLAFSSRYLDMPENKRLRELYIAARYGDPKAVTAEQVGEARRCLGVIEAEKARVAE